MSEHKFNVVILGLSITSSWGNGHATTYRGLVRGLAEMGHDILFLERNKPWYSSQRDLPRPPHCRTELYESLDELRERFEKEVRQADVVIVGSYVPEGALLGEWVLRTARGVKAFYDIDTPVTLHGLSRGSTEYIRRSQVPRYDLYLSFTGGPTLTRLERTFGSPAARLLYCSVDPQAYRPEHQPVKWDLGYLGTYSQDRQPALGELLIEPASIWNKGRFAVAGSLYPESIAWPSNVARIEHIPPQQHRCFYNSQKFTLNVTRADMVRAGYSPSVRLFEAAACAVPIISDYWVGLNDVLKIGSEVLVAHNREEVLRFLQQTSREEAQAIGMRARAKIIRYHSYQVRACELDSYIRERLERGAERQSRREPRVTVPSAVNA